MKGYRYLHPDWADAFALGNVLIRTVEEFRRMEAPQGDRLDSAVSNKIGHHVFEDGNRNPTLMEMGIYMDGDQPSRAEVYGLERVVTLPGLAMCVCKVPDSEAFPSKTAIFEIRDLEAYAAAITKTGLLGRRVRVGEVTYDTREFDALEGMGRPDPFIKGTDYEPEQELRIYWPARAASFVKLSAPETSRMVERIA